MSAGSEGGGAIALGMWFRNTPMLEMRALPNPAQYLENIHRPDSLVEHAVIPAGNVVCQTAERCFNVWRGEAANLPLARTMMW
jgi:hypothetical protein